MNIIAIVPARGGSKGIPDKNKKPVCGKPLINYTIEAALESKLFKYVAVTSDDQDILDIARNYGCEIVERPAAIAQDNSPVTEAIGHAVKTIEEKNNDVIDIIMLLQPTAPIREQFHLSESIKLITKENTASVVSVCEMNEIHPARMYQMKDEVLESLIPEYENKRRQEIEPVYYRNGSIYIVHKKEFLAQRTVMAKPSRGYVMETKYLLNIDEKRDIIIAEPLIRAWKENRL